MNKTNIPCWIETHRRMNWTMAMRIASLPHDRWTSKITEWNPDLDNKIKTNRSVGRPRKRWEDEINEQVRSEEWEETKRQRLEKQQYMESTSKKKKNGKQRKQSLQRKTVANPGVDEVTKCKEISASTLSFQTILHDRDRSLPGRILCASTTMRTC